MEKQYSVLGKRIPKVDGVEIVTGKAKFTVDLTLPHMLHGKIKRSPYPHAKIKSIDTSKAEALYGVRAVVTGMDFPDRKLPGCLCDGYPVARDRVLYIGEPVAIKIESRPVPIKNKTILFLHFFTIAIILNKKANIPIWNP